jgi:hypothetical protein
MVGSISEVFKDGGWLDQLAVQDRSSARELAKVDMRPQLFISVYSGLLFMFLSGNIAVSPDDKDALIALTGAYYRRLSSRSSTSSSAPSPVPRRGLTRWP